MLLCFCYLIMFLHSCAHLLHASAHCLHMSILSPIFSHSAAHASHISAHISHICFAYSLPLLIIMAAILHMSAQSLHIIMHLPIMPIISLFVIVMHSVQQASQAIAHSLQLSIHVWYCWFFNIEEVVLFIVFVCAKNYIYLSKKYDKKTNYVQYLHINNIKNTIF